MSLEQTVKRLALILAIPVVGIAGYNFSAHNNLNYEIDGTKVVQRSDGIFAYTTLKIKEDGAIEITRNNLLNLRTYREDNGDGKVDEVDITLGNTFTRDSSSRTFRRNIDLKKYPDVFQDADAYFRKEMEKFKPYL